MEIWSLRGIETLNVSLVEENGSIYYTMHCQSFHLTSFAVLLDVHGVLMVIANERVLAKLIIRTD